MKIILSHFGMLFPEHYQEIEKASRFLENAPGQHVYL